MGVDMALIVDMDDVDDAAEASLSRDLSHLSWVELSQSKVVYNDAN